MNIPHKAHKIILQRAVAHYRAPLFTALSAHGWHVISSSNFPNHTEQLATSDKPYSFETRTPFFFPFKKNPNWCGVPIFKILKSTSPDILLIEAGTYMSSTWKLALFCRLKKARKTRIIFWGHGLMPQAEKNFKFTLKKHLKKFLINSVDGYLCYTDTDAQLLKTLNLKKPLFTAGNTVDISQAQKLRQAPQKRKAKNFLYVGRLNTNKNIKKLLQAFNITHKNYPETTLTIIGDGPEKSAILKQINSLNLQQSTRLISAIYDEKMLSAYFHQADAYVTAGAVGLGVNHALSYGVPVLCFEASEHTPHSPEISYVKNNHTGWKVSSHSTHDFAEKMSDIITASHTPKYDMYEGIITFADTHLTIDKMVTNIEQMAKQIHP